MKQLVLLTCCLFLFLFCTSAPAKTVYDVELPETINSAGETLQLNGYGLRSKFFFKIYLGSLYTGSKADSTAQILAQPGAKLIRMNFIYNKVEKEKIVDAFAEGFEKNSPQLKNDPALQQFLKLFTADFVAGDQVDLELAADGNVSATHNGTKLGSVTSKELGNAVLLIYLGEQPADDDLKQGMLGQD